MEVANSEVLLFDHEAKKEQGNPSPSSISLGYLCVAVRVSFLFAISWQLHPFLPHDSFGKPASIRHILYVTPSLLAVVGLGQEDPLLKLDQFRKHKTLVSLNTNRSVMLLTKLIATNYSQRTDFISFKNQNLFPWGFCPIWFNNQRKDFISDLCNINSTKMQILSAQSALKNHVSLSMMAMMVMMMIMMTEEEVIQ